MEVVQAHEATFAASLDGVAGEVFDHAAGDAGDVFTAADESVTVGAHGLIVFGGEARKEIHAGSFVDWGEADEGGIEAEGVGDAGVIHAGNTARKV